MYSNLSCVDTGLKCTDSKVEYRYRKWKSISGQWNHNYSILRMKGHEQKKGHEQGPQEWSIYLIYTVVGVYLIQSEVEDNQTRKQAWIDTKMLISSNG